MVEGLTLDQLRTFIVAAEQMGLAHDLLVDARP
jgi:hypothetical protein